TETRKCYHSPPVRSTRAPSRSTTSTRRGEPGFMTRRERQAKIDQYDEGYAEVTTALQGFPKEALVAHPFPGKWSACEIVHHLADSEAQSGFRLRKLLAEEYPVLQGYDQDVFAVVLRYNLRDFSPALELFRAVRATTLQLLH